MTPACTRCGGHSADGSSVCGRCGATILVSASNESASTWGGLDVQRTSAPRVGAVADTLKEARPPAGNRVSAPTRPRGAQSPAGAAKPVVNVVKRPAANSGAAAVAVARTGLPELIANDDPLGVFDTGLVDFGDFAAAGGAAMHLDVVSMPPPQLAGTPVAKRAEETREQRVDELSGYGAQPRKLHESVPYFVRVMLRKRALEAELSALTQHRKRLEAQAEDAQYALGEALYALRDDARLRPIAQQLRVVAETKTQVGAKEAAGQHASEEHSRELEKLADDVRKVESDVLPLRKRETDLQATADKLKSQLKRNEAQVRKLEAELKTLRSSPDVTAIDRIAALEAERDAHVGDSQSRNVQLLPLNEDLGALRREIAKHMGTVAALHEEERRNAQAKDREQERHRFTTGGARSALKDAVRSLASAAQRTKLDGLALTQAKAAAEAEGRLKTKLATEELQRAAVQSYDPDAYKQGMYILVGGTGAVFLLFAALIIF